MKYKRGDRFIITIGPGQPAADGGNCYSITGIGAYLMESELNQLTQINGMASDEGELLIIFENGREMLLDKVAGVELFFNNVEIMFTNGNRSHIKDKVKYIGRPEAKSVE